LIGCDSGSEYKFNLLMLNSTTNQWSLFTNSSYFYNSGQFNTGFTVLKNLFSDYSSQIIWKVELVVNVALNLDSNQTFQGSTSVQFFVNFPPLAGVCIITPTVGNTTDIFNIICNSWTDPDGSITKYAYYGMK